MKATVVAVLVLAGMAPAQQKQDAPALTIYNQDFAVVRQHVPMELKAGLNAIHFDDVTAAVEPDSVILRGPAGDSLRVLEQNYRNDPVSQASLLSRFEGQTITFAVQHGEKQAMIPGKVVRSGYVPGGEPVQPIIEVEGALQFSLPGEPRFPALGGGAILKPTFDWKLESTRSGHADAQLSYITGGMSWAADYNIVAAPGGDTLEVVGWVTLKNQSGKVFEDASIKLMAGDVNKIAPAKAVYAYDSIGRLREAEAPQPQVTEKTFDEYHLYTLANRTTLHDQETKQVEFIRASGVKSQRIYVYDGAAGSNRDEDSEPEQSQAFGTQSNSKVAVYQEFKNSKENHLGMPLPKGRARFYRQDVEAGGKEGQVEFTGENTIDHTPENEKVKVYTGNAFDVVGERKQTNFVDDEPHKRMDESYLITIRNHKKETVQVHVTEHLYRWNTWRVLTSSVPFNKIDSQTIELVVDVPANGERTVDYKVRYTW